MKYEVIKDYYSPTAGSLSEGQTLEVTKIRNRVLIQKEFSVSSFYMTLAAWYNFKSRCLKAK